MNKTRTAAKYFAGLAVISTLFISVLSAPAQAKSVGWDSTTSSPTKLGDSGWD
jgi:hypothetical protein